MSERAPPAEAPRVEVGDPAAEIERSGPALSRRVIAEMYAANPFWRERFGDRGRRHADEDGDFHIRYLVESLRAGSPAVMVRYARWLRDLLAARGMCTRHLADNFDRLATAISAAQLDGGALAVRTLAEAEAALAHEAPAARAVQERSGALADAVVAALRARHPDWYAAAGGAAADAVIGAGTNTHATGAGAGWARCRDDLLYHLSYLADAVAAGGDPAAFAAYVRFAAGFLAKRGVPDGHLRELLVALRDALEAAGAPLAPALPVLEAGLAALEPPVPIP